MTDELSDVHSLRSQAKRAKQRYFTLGALLGVSLLGLAVSVVFGGTFPFNLFGTLTIASGVGVAITRSRYGEAASAFEEICTHEAEQCISNGLTAIQSLSLDVAESAFKRAARYGELSSSEIPRSTEESVYYAEIDGRDDTVPLTYRVSNTYLDLLDRHRGSRYDYSSLDTQFSDIATTFESGGHGAAVSQLIDVADTLADGSPAIESFRQSADLDSVDAVSDTPSRKLTGAGYSDPVYVANLSVDELTETLDIERQEAESIRSACRSRVEDVGFIGRIVEDEDSIEDYRESWNEVAIQIRAECLAEAADILETEIADLPDWQEIDPNNVASLREHIGEIRLEALQRVEPLVSLRESVSSYSWVTVDLSVVTPVAALQGHHRVTVAETRDYALAIALADHEALTEDFVISNSKATSTRKATLDQLTRGGAPHDQLATAVSEFEEYLRLFDYIDDWSEFTDVAQEAETALKRARDSVSEEPSTNGTDTTETLESAREQIQRLESLLDNTAFPDPIHSECKRRYDELSEQLTETAATVRHHQREAREDVEDTLEQAEQEADSGHIENAKATLDEAKDTFSTARSILDPTDIAAIEERIQQVDSNVTVPLFEERIAEQEAEVQSVGERIETDTNSATQQLSTIESNLDDLQTEMGCEVRNQTQAKGLLDEIKEVRELSTEVQEQIERQAAEEALIEAWESINRAESLANDGEKEQAKSSLQEATSRLRVAASALEESETTEAQTAIERVEDQITAIRFQAAIADIESRIETIREGSVATLASREDELRAVETRVESLSEEIDAEISTVTQHQELQEHITDLENSIADIEHQLTVERKRHRLEEANNQLDEAQDSIGAGELRVAPGKIAAAEEIVQEIEVPELDAEIDEFHTAVATTRAELHEACIRYALDETTHELNRAKGYLQHDVDDTRDCLETARAHLTAAEQFLDSYTVSEIAREELLAEVDRRHSEVNTLVERCREREIAEAIEATRESIGRAQTTFQEEDITEAREITQEAASRLESIPEDASASKVNSVQEELETAQTKIAQYEIGEHIANAEATVDQAEAERSAGEVGEAIDAYQRAISTYEAAKLEAESLSTPEAYEIDVRIEQLSGEIENVRDQWADTRTQQIDRELRAGERAIAQGLDAVRDGDIDTAEAKYESADGAAAAAQTLLKETPTNPPGGELTLPETLASEYQSAYNSLVGHLGYLRTQIEEEKDASTGTDSRATPLAEYYDGLYTVYRALPDNAHPIWHDALTAVLFGGDGLAEGASGYGTQQADRTETPISTLREENGDGDRITDFVCIETSSSRTEDRDRVSAEQQLPVAPQSGTVLPIAVDSESVSEALSLLSEFPAAPEADHGNQDSDSIIEISYFEDRLVTESAATPEHRERDSGDSEEKSRELETLMDQIESEINDLRDSA